jgi:hypothetical protein
MKIVVFCMTAGLAFSLPFAVFAQQSAATGTPADAQYCRALGRAFNSMFPKNGTPSVIDDATIEQCGSNPQVAIPVLEKKLSDWKIELPPDARVAPPSTARAKTQ